MNTSPSLRAKRGVKQKWEMAGVDQSSQNAGVPEASSQIRPLFGPRGNAARQDVLSAADLDAVSEEEDFEAWVAYRKAKKEKTKENREGK